MGEQLKISCARPVSGPVIEEMQEGKEGKISGKEIKVDAYRKKGSRFYSSCIPNGSFVNIKLSDCIWKWVILCFYPGDFKKLGVEVLSISIDSVFVHKMWNARAF